MSNYNWNWQPVTLMCGNFKIGTANKVLVDKTIQIQKVVFIIGSYANVLAISDLFKKLEIDDTF